MTSLEDWILDVCWLPTDSDTVCGAYKVAAVTAHNVVHVMECSGSGRAAEVVANYYCEVNCILYPMAMVKPMKTSVRREHYKSI